MVRSSRSLAWLSAACIFVLSGCGAKDAQDKGSPKELNVVSVRVSIGFQNSVPSSAMKAPLGTFNDVASVTVDVLNGGSPIISGQALTLNNGAWSGSLADLPTSMGLTFRGHAYNSASVELFNGVTLQTLISTDDAVIITLSAVDDGISAALPRIAQIVTPASVLASAAGEISISIEGAPNETLSYEISAATNGGSFAPSTGIILLTGGKADVVTVYTAPAEAGVYTHTVKVANSRGIFAETSFDTIVSGTASARAASFGATKVNLEWAAYGLTADACNIYRSSSSGTLGTKIATTTGNTTGYQDAGLAPGAAYYYTVECMAAGGSSVTSGQVTATTGAVPAFPAPVTGMTAARNGNIVTLSWDDYHGAALYDLYRSSIPDIQCGMWGSMTDIGGPFVTSVNDTIAGNGRYTYCLAVYDSTGTQSARAQVILDVPAGTLPGVESPLLNSWSSGKDLSVVHLYWWAAPGADAHHVYASSEQTKITPKQGGSGIPLDVGPFAIPVYQVSPGYYGMDIPLSRLSPGYTWFAVEAVKGSYAADSGGIGMLVAAPAPVGVTGVRTSAFNPTTLDVSWTAAAGAATYKVYRLASAAETISSSSLIATTSATTYRDTGRTPDTTYYYRITAIAGGAGGGAPSDPSDYAAGKTLSSTAPLTWPPLVIPFTGQALLSWTGHNSGTTFKIYGGGALIPTAIDPDNLVVWTNLDPLTGLSAWQHTVGAPAEAYLVFNLSAGVAIVYGHYWITEVYPDGSESDRSEFILFGFM